jgi:putative ABC transport system permease protein
MFQHYFKTVLRQLWKKRLFSLVNIIGLSVGLASVMALLIGVYMYMTTDTMHKDKDRMYYLKTSVPDGDSYMQTTYPLLGEIVKNCPEVEAATHKQSWYSPWLKNGEKEAQENTVFVDTSFFGVYSFPLKYGTASNALKEKFSAVISEKVSMQLFGNTNPVGKSILADDTITLTVTAVLKEIPVNSTLRADVFLTTQLLAANTDFSGNANWYNGFAENYLKLKPGTDVKLFESKIAKIVALNYEKEVRNQKVMAVPFSSLKNEAGPIVNLIIYGSIGTAIFVLLIILVNLLNLNAASIYNRTKEVAVKQMIGSGKGKIITQFCVENAVIVFFSILTAGLLFYFVLLPQMNNMYGSRFGEMSFSFQKDYPFALLFLLLGFIITIIAGSLPALKLISLPVSDAVKGKLSKRAGNHTIRNIFITVQFALAIIFICITVILNRQIDHMKTASLGFNKADVVTVNLDMAFRNQEAANTYFETILNKLRANANVKSVSTNVVVPSAYWNNYNNFYDPATNKEIRIRHMNADAGYTSTFEIPVIEGRSFNDALSATETSNVMINRTAMKALGWTSIDGKTIKSKGNDQVFTVVGVMEDFHYQDMQKPVEPLLHWYGGKQGLNYNNYLSINVRGNHKKEVLQQLEADMKAIPARRAFSYEYMSDKVSKQYTLIDGILKTTNFVAFLTIIISCMGMFGLISLFAKQRVKEIGIRKVLGAGVPGIVALLSRDFIRLVIIACVIAFPVAWWAMNSWLQSFVYRINIQWWMFAVAGFISLLIAIITVGVQAVKAAIANPVKSLRAE